MRPPTGAPDIVHTSFRTVVQRMRLPDGRPVIVKMLAAEHPSLDDVAMIEREVELLRRVAGPGVVRVIGLEEIASKPALVLEDGGYRRIPSEMLALGTFLRVAIAVSRALVRVHAANLVHGNVNPSNIVWRDTDGDVCLIDFRISFEPMDARAADGRMMGSVEYIAPEQTGRTSRGIDHRADLYSLGATCFLWLTGRLPFEENDPLGYVHAHLSKPVPRASATADVPEVLTRIVARLMAKEPEARYQSAGALLVDLEKCERSFVESGAIATFEIGAHDRTPKAILPAGLVERDAALRAVSAVRGGMLVVSGAVGSGKSAVLDEARGLRAGRVALVRCNASMEAVPLGGLAAVFAAIADDVLVQSAEVLEARRRAWNAAVAPNGAVLVEIEPRLDAVLGAQARVAAMGARAADQRRKQTVEALFRVIAAEGPLSVIIDDAEWLDEASTRMLLHLAARGIGDLAIILAMEQARAVKLVIEAGGVGIEGDRLEHVVLDSISVAGVSAVVAGMLGQGEASVEGLARALHAKTGGNPLLFAEIVDRIQDGGLLAFDRERAEWQWNEAAVWALPVSGSAVSLMIERLDALGAPCRAVLAVAACFGPDVDLAVLREVAEGADVDAAVAEAEAQRVLLPPRGGTFTFAHRGIWEAIYAATSDDVRAAAHLRLARRMDARIPSAMVAQELFAAVRHYRAARSSITTLDERRMVAALECDAAARARAAAGYAVAADHLEAALAIVGADEQPPVERFALQHARVECIQLTGDITRAQQLGAELLALAPGPIERASVYGLQASVLSFQNRFLETIETIRAGLREVGVELPADPSKIQAAIGAGLGAMQAVLAERTPRELAALPEMRDPQHVQAMSLLVLLIPAAHQIAPPVFVLAELMMFDLAVKHGVVASSAKNFVDCGIIQVKAFRDQARALEFADAAFALIERFRPTPHESAVRAVYGAFVAQWRDDPATIVATLEKAQREGIALGDIQHASYAASWQGTVQRVTGAPLPATLATLERAAAFTTLAGAALPALFASIETELVRTIVDGVGDTHQAFLEKAMAGGPIPTVLALQGECVRHYVMRELARARECVVRLEPLADVAEGLVWQCERMVFIALVHADLAVHAADAETRETSRQMVEATAETLRGWRSFNPRMFAAQSQLLEAERCRIAGGAPDAIAALYDTVVDDPMNKALHLKALACERQAEYWIERGRRRLARPLLREAYTFYERWGAKAKLRQLSVTYPELATQSSPEATRGIRTSVGDVHLDVDSVVKAVAAISSEVKPERLFAALMATIVENAGAERGCLISAHDGLWVEARASVDAPVGLARVRLDNAPLVSREVVRYVARTMSPLILADAAEDDRFAGDSYLASGDVRSVLCVPIVAAGGLRGVLYVENNAVAGAFTSRHVRMLTIIAGQAATSIENARMYERLEDMVRSRTSELANRNREMGALLDALPQGVFTIGRDLRVEPGFSARLPDLLGVADVVGRGVQELLFGSSSDISPETLQRHQQALEWSFGMDPMFAEINWEHLIRSVRRDTPRGESMFEIDWASILDEDGNVARILATLRDVTELRALERRLATVSEETAIIDEVLGAGPDAFHEYCDNARHVLARCRTLLGGARASDPATIQEIYRHLHTLKGNARMLALAGISRVIHTEEDAYSTFHELGADANAAAQLGAGIDRLVTFVATRAAIVARKLGDSRKGGRSLTAEALETIEAELQRAHANPAMAAQALRQIAATIRTVSLTPLAEVVRNVARGFASLAADVGKPVPELAIDADEVCVDPRTARAFSDAFVHVFRNSLDHGIEPAEQRARAGKPSSGRVEVVIRRHEDEVRVTVGDDGRGLALAALRARAVPGDDTELAASVFRSGVSTAQDVTDISGRGVGMNAVRSFLAAQGGSVDIEFTGAERDGHRPFVLVMRVPRHAAAA